MLKNAILELLPRNELAIVIEHSTTVRLSEQEWLYRAGDPLDHVYFLLSGTISLLASTKEGNTIETGLIGREGLVGSEAVLGVTRAPAEIVVQTGGDAVRMPTAQLLQSSKAMPVLFGLIDEQIQSLLFEARQNALCHALHPIDARYCRRLLQASDLLESPIVDMTQDSIARILGAQRTSVSMIAHTLQQRGCIRTRRGKIELRDRVHLEKVTCECYAKLRQHAQSREASRRAHRDRRSDEVSRANAR